LLGRGNKYGARRAVDGNGRSYDSTAERDRAAELQLLEQAGEIRNLQAQPRVELEPMIFYKPDFAYEELPMAWMRDDPAHATWRLIHEDVKGVVTERFRLICKLWAIHGPGPLRITQRRSKREGFRVTREILPKGDA
jgi:hypothetical protein